MSDAQELTVDLLKKGRMKWAELLSVSEDNLKIVEEDDE